MKEKLVFIAPSNSVHSKKWIESFLDSNFEIYWVSFYRKTVDIHMNIKYYEIRKNPVRAYYEMAKLLKLIDADIVHYHYLGYQLFLIPLLKINNLVTSPWGSDLKFSKRLSLKGYFISRIFRKSEIITVDADFMFSEVGKMGEGHLPKVRRINYGTDLNVFEFASKMRGDVFKIVSLRNHEEIYDIDKLIKAAAILKESNYKISFSLFGSGSKTEELRILASKLELEDVITFCGGYEYSTLSQTLHEYDLYISTSTTDAGLSASTSEAMSSGVTVLSADNSENPFWMNDNCGFTFKTGAVDDLVLRIVEILNMSQKELDLSRKNARKKIEKYNDYSNEMTKMLEIYNGLLI